MISNKVYFSALTEIRVLSYKSIKDVKKYANVIQLRKKK